MKSIKVILTLSVISIVILACGDSEKPAAIVAPEPKPNLSPPVIKEIVVPDQVHAGSRGIKLEAVVEDPDGNSGLTYNWEAPGILPSYTKTWVTTWNPPIDLGVATITLTVNDGIHETTKSVDVNVIHALIVPGQEAAGIRLGDRLKRATDLYGEPSHQAEKNWDWEFANDIEWLQWRYWDIIAKWHDAGLTLFFRNKRVVQISIGSPNPSESKTADGITLGSHREDARRLWGPNNGGGGDSSYRADYWSSKGIEIRTNMSIIKWILIFPKKPIYWVPF